VDFAWGEDAESGKDSEGYEEAMLAGNESHFSDPVGERLCERSGTWSESGWIVEVDAEGEGPFAPGSTLCKCWVS